MSDALRLRLKIVLRRREAYRALFLGGGADGLSQDAEIVLADLRRACCADRPTTRTSVGGAVDPIATAMNEGKREVWLRIQQALRLDDAAIHRMMDASEVVE